MLEAPEYMALSGDELRQHFKKIFESGGEDPFLWQFQAIRKPIRHGVEVSAFRPNGSDLCQPGAPPQESDDGEQSSPNGAALP